MRNIKNKNICKKREYSTLLVYSLIYTENLQIFIINLKTILFYLSFQKRLFLIVNYVNILLNNFNHVLLKINDFFFTKTLKEIKKYLIFLNLHNIKNS